MHTAVALLMRLIPKRQSGNLTPNDELERVKLAVLEVDGQVSVVQKD